MSTVAQLGGSAPECDVTGDDKDVAPKRCTAADGTHLVRLYSHKALDLGASHRRCCSVIVIAEQRRIG
eukprot:CAMPEP_0181224476 /NCGR_PEP_ID=MMETSP1096-20121128/31148_1 /TAXON_ID=156174 ORGANISM="Chrysochromulina ericina, Strain CCMP281" /NCGR_SAMPLE_ID=MMETSP1096 /ASSEMBLY_ACC=CAM_ASM_000453 /LENGTH=67 /DNA_ID=CAMNT_0023317563 /DNA_START=332 /DNA_END=535 /DNA_ORIENTATION=+